MKIRFDVHRNRPAVSVAVMVAAILSAASVAQAQQFTPGDLLVTTSTYSDTGAAAGLVAGTSQLPGTNASNTVTANANGSYSQVFNNSTVDASFGVTSQITLEQLTTTGSFVIRARALASGIAATALRSRRTWCNGSAPEVGPSLARSD